MKTVKKKTKPFSATELKRLIRLFATLETFLVEDDRQSHQAVDCIIFLRDFLMEVENGSLS